MNDSADGSSTVKLSDLLRHADDLEKISALKADFTRKKAAVDAQLKLGLTEQLQLTKTGMSSIRDGQITVNLIKEEMMKIDRLCADAQTMIKRFPEINAVAQAHRNFAAVEEMKNNIESFPSRLANIKKLIEEDEAQIEEQPNLLQIHHEISQLRSIRDDAMAQIKKADDAGYEDTLLEQFRGLDEAIEDFDDHVGRICMQLIPLVQEGNTGIIVRVAIVIEEEEKFDNRIKELQDAQREYKDLASRFQSLAQGSTELRGYKDKFIEAIKMSAQEQFDQSNQMFQEDPDKLEKSVRWFFNDLNTVKLGMLNLMPRKWRIFHTYIGIYHQIMHDWLAHMAESDETSPSHMVAIIHWKEKYYAKMAKLGASSKDMTPDLPGGRDSDLVREYRQLIVNKVDEWMEQINKTDRQAFLARSEAALDHDEHGRFRTKTLGDMWRMLREQITVAATADLAEITEGVCDAMFRALKARQDMWNGLLNDEFLRYTRPNADQEGIQGLQDWLIALANDQIACIIEEPPPQDDVSQQDGAVPQLGYLPAFRADYESVVGMEYVHAASLKIDMLRDGLTDLGVRCITVFAKLIFAVDFRNIVGEFFTPAWYTRKAMAQITTTFEDYLGDYAQVVHPSLHDLLVEEMAKQLLVSYLGSVSNRGAKFRRADSYNDKVKDDVATVFRFFEKYPESFDNVKQQWRVLQGVIALVEVDKHALPGEAMAFLAEYPDTKLPWIEAVLRSREDIDFGPLGDGKSIMKTIRTQAADTRVEKGVETIMADVLATGVGGR